jgi:DNA polymerase IV
VKSSGFGNGMQSPQRRTSRDRYEMMFQQEIADREVLQAWLLDLTKQGDCRLWRHGLRGRTVHLTIQFADFSLLNRSQTLPEPTDITQELWRAADELLCRRLPPGHLPVRLLGMGDYWASANGWCAWDIRLGCCPSCGSIRWTCSSSGTTTFELQGSS